MRGDRERRRVSQAGARELPRFEGVGVYYAATFMEAQLCADEDVIVIGGGNSAGQAAVFLAQTAQRVHILVRSRGLADTMSRYLVRRIEENPAIIAAYAHGDRGAGGRRVSGARVAGATTLRATIEQRDIRHVFVMAGAVPATQWVDGCLAVDDKGFVMTGADLPHETLIGAHWPLARVAPYLLETSLPGVFAVGDVRAGNVKRVTSAVGRGLDCDFVRSPVLAE